MLKGKLQWISQQTPIWKILINYKFKQRGIYVQDLTSQVSSDIVVEPPIKLGKVIVSDKVTIGKHTYIFSGMLFRNVSIGRYCSIGNNVVIGPDEHATHYLTTSTFGRTEDDFYDRMIAKKTVVQNDVWIGANVIILRGVTIGDGAVIGAGAVVSKDVPAYSIVAGVPAKIIRYRFDEETIKQLQELKWWEIDESKLKCLDFSKIDECIKTLKLLRGFEY